VLPHADFVVIAAPETPETRHLIGAAEPARMKPSARVVNVSWGWLLDEMALVQTLKEQRLGGAALDVTAIEPLAPESPLWKTPHLMITPHTSAVSDRLWKRQTEILAELLERWFGGRELFNRVDLSRGY
jgi:phosphoglycerate dehydrogenase-like enzyme